MAVIKQKTVYICTHCGCESSKWCGKCPSCGEWNCMEEQLISSAPAAKVKSVIASAGSLNVRSLENIDTKDEFRYKTGMGELDRVLGGGIVKGAVMLISGDPGIGKSTLMLQICRQMEKAEYRVLYVSGEESQRQIKLRADRLGINSARVDIMSCSDVPAIIDYINGQNYDLVIIDSIQTMSLPQVSSSAGSVTQIRECTSALLQLAKSSETPIFIVGHVNKDGAIAGPKVLEHIVDAVLYFEGDKNLSYRILRAVKNRFGSTNEIGVFEMSDVGLCEVPNPSQMLLSGRPKGVPGTCVVCAMEGTRPILAEVQGLVSVSAFGNPRRMSTGYDYNRLNMIHSAGVRAGVALKPATSLHMLDYVLEKCDTVLLMLINPGYASDKAEHQMSYSGRKIRELKRMINERGTQTKIELDGRVSIQNIEDYGAGLADIFVAGSTCIDRNGISHSSSVLIKKRLQILGEEK